MRLRLREDAPGLLRIERTQPGRWSRRLRTLALVNVLVGFLFVPSAVANPFCYIPGVCEVKEAVDFASDPLGYLLDKLTEANIWFLRKMLELIQNTSKIDLTSADFVKQYALIFAASTILTVALWLVAVAKRAVRGVGLTTAISEAVGFLALQFVVNALTPGAIALLMKAIDEITAIFEPYATKNFKPFLDNILKVMASRPDNGLGQLLVVNLIMLAGALLMWIELLIRSAAIYVAVALGPIVNAGLVDKDLWGKSKKWFGALFSLGLTKPVLFALLGLGGAVLSDTSGKGHDDGTSKTLVGALILLLAVFASATLYKWLPVFGDEMASLHHDRKTAMASGPASMVDGPGQHANRAMNTHIQDALVGGGKKSASGSKAMAKGMATSSAGGGTAMAGPIGAVATAGKAAVDLGKNKAATSPGAQGTDTAGDGAEQKQPQQDEMGQAPDTPASARPQGATTGPVVSTDRGQGPAPGQTPERGPRPGPAASSAPGSGPVVRGPGTNGTPPTPTPPSSPPSPPPPSSAPGTTSGSGPSTPSTPPDRPTGGQQLPGRPDPSKDQ